MLMGLTHLKNLKPCIRKGKSCQKLLFVLKEVKSGYRLEGFII